MIDFNGMFTHLGLFYAKWLGNHVPIYIYVVVEEETGLHTVLLNMNYLNRSIWGIDRTLTGITTPGQSGLESNDNEGVFQIFRTGTFLSDTV